MTKGIEVREYTKKYNFFDCVNLSFDPEEKRFEIAKQLLKSDEGINKQSTANGLTPLNLACHHGNNAPIIEFFLEHGADIHLRDNDGRTPILTVCNRTPVLTTANFSHKEKTPFEIMDILLKHGANINDIDNEGKNILHMLCYRKTPLPAIKLVIDSGFNVKAINAIDNENKTPFMYLMLDSKFPIKTINYLLEQGADPTIKSSANFSAPEFFYKRYQMTQYPADRIVLEKLIQSGVKLEEYNAYTKNGFENILNLLKKDCDFSTKNNLSNFRKEKLSEILEEYEAKKFNKITASIPDIGFSL